MNTAKTCRDISITFSQSDLAVIGQIVDFDRGYRMSVVANDLGLQYTTSDNDPCVFQLFNPQSRFHAGLPGAGTATAEDYVFVAGVPLGEIKTFLELAAG